MTREADRSDETARHLAEGEAALVLLQSLLLTLVGKGTITSEEVLASVESVVDVKRQIAASGSSPELSAIAAGLLVQIGNSLAAATHGPGADGVGDPRRDAELSPREHR